MMELDELTDKIRDQLYALGAAVVMYKFVDGKVVGELIDPKDYLKRISS